LKETTGFLASQGFDYTLDSTDMDLSSNPTQNRSYFEDICTAVNFPHCIVDPICGNAVLSDFSSFTNIKADLFRNYSISIVIIPLVAIFFLLGASLFLKILMRILATG
jgi:hypothetical protein